MSDWICPDCGGGFPGDAFIHSRASAAHQCPWCLNPLAVVDGTDGRDRSDPEEAGR